MDYRKAILEAEAKGFFTQLEEIYNDVPTCHGCISCKSCCSESVNTSFVEFLYILKHYDPNAFGISVFKDDLIRRLLAFEVKSLTVAQKCPFLNNEGLCEIYHARPLACRVFGTRSRKDYDVNYHQILKQNIRSAQQIEKQTGSRPSNAIVYRAIDFCEYVKTPKFTSDLMLQSWQDQLVNMEGQLYFQGLMSMDLLNGDLVGHFIKLTFSEEMTYLTPVLLQEIKYDLMKDYQKHRKDLKKT